MHRVIKSFTAKKAAGIPVQHASAGSLHICPQQGAQGPRVKQERGTSKPAVRHETAARNPERALAPTTLSSVPLLTLRRERAVSLRSSYCRSCQPPRRSVSVSRACSGTMAFGHGCRHEWAWTLQQAGKMQRVP